MSRRSSKQRRAARRRRDAYQPLTAREILRRSAAWLVEWERQRPDREAAFWHLYDHILDRLLALEERRLLP